MHQIGFVPNGWALGSWNLVHGVPSCPPVRRHPAHPAHFNPCPALTSKVPSPQKDVAKSLGAKWDATIGSWYVPETLDLAPFAPSLSGSLAL